MKHIAIKLATKLNGFTACETAGQFKEQCGGALPDAVEHIWAKCYAGPSGARSVFTKHDLRLAPSTPCTAWPLTKLGPKTIGGIDVPPRGHAVFTPLINHALAPAVSIPCGRGRDGLPVGLQIIGPRGADYRVLAAGRAAEMLLADLHDYPRC